MADRDSTTGPTAKAGTKRKRPWLRRVGVVVGCLLAGAIINVLVAWGCAYWSVGGEIYESGSSSFATEEEAIWLAQFDFSAIDYVVTSNFTWRTGARTGLGFEIRSYARRQNGMIFGGDGRNLVTVTKAGWPFLALESIETYGGIDRKHFSISNHQRALLVDREVDLFGLGAETLPRPLPLKPRVLGFTINTIIFAAVLCSMTWVPWSIRRTRRTKRNRCPDCGYDLRGADHGKCPECGEAV